MYRPSTRRINAAFLFQVTLRRYDIVEHAHFIHEPRGLPVVLSPEEVTGLLDAAPRGLRCRAARHRPEQKAQSHMPLLRLLSGVRISLGEIGGNSRRRLSTQRADASATTTETAEASAPIKIAVSVLGKVGV